MREIVVVGASLAGVNAAQALRDEGFEGELTLVGAEREPPYDRPPLSKEALLEGPVGRDLALRDAAFYGAGDVRLVLGRRAVALDPGDRSVTLDDGATLSFDGLVIATGSRPRTLPGVPRGVRVLRTIDDCLALRADLRPGRRVAIVGAGFIGLEVAATASALGVEVTVVEAADVPMNRVLGPELGQWLVEKHVAAGVEMRCGVGVQTVDADGRTFKLRLSDGSSLAADAVLLATGVAPNIEWLDGSGITVGDGVLCDAYCRTEAPGVVAAGDVARWYNPLFDEQMRVEHWTNAVEQGRAAAVNLLRPREPRPYPSVPYFWSDQHGDKVRFVGQTCAATDVAVVERETDRLIVLYGRDGCLSGALTVNAPRAMASYRKLIADRVRWSDALDA